MSVAYYDEHSPRIAAEMEETVSVEPDVDLAHRLAKQRDEYLQNAAAERGAAERSSKEAHRWQHMADALGLAIDKLLPQKSSEVYPASWSVARDPAQTVQSDPTPFPHGR